MAKKKTIWIGVIPDIFGYGITVAEENEDACKKALKRAYLTWKASYKKYHKEDTLPFSVAFTEWGGRIQEVELGKGYYDNFGS